MMHYDAATGNWEVTGRITIAYRNGSATGDKLVYNPRTHRASLTGHVTLQRGGQAYEAERADMDTSTRLFSITNFKGAIAPSELQNQVSQPIYLSGSSLANTQGGAVQVENGRVTSCDPPQYWIDARQITVIPGDRADFRDAEIVLLNHRILKVNHLSFSLRESQRNRLLPEVGENSVEGYFAKERLPVGLGRIGAGLLLLDLMSKKGVGKGFDDAYRLLRGAGRVQFYQLHEKDTGTEDLNGSLEDNRRIGDFSTTLNTNYSKNSYTQQAIYGSQQTAFNGNFGLNRSSAKSSTNATFSLSDTNSSFSDSKSLNGFIRQHFSISQALSTDLNFTRQLSSYLTRSTLGGPIAPTPSSGQNEYQVTVTDSAPALTTVMASDVHQPFGRSALFFVERYPEITFTTSSARLLPLRQLPTGQPLISATGPAQLPSPRVPAGPVPPAHSSGAASPAPSGVTPSTPPGVTPSTPPGGTSPAPPGGTSTAPPAAGPASPASTPSASTPSASTPSAPTSSSPGAAPSPFPAVPAAIGAASGPRARPGSAAAARVSPPSRWYDRSPVNFSLSLGHYREEPANTRLNRVDMNLDSAVPEHSVFRGLSISGNGRFEQKMTSDGTAQYIFNVNSTLNHSFSREASFNGTYYRIQPIGYTPFQFDRSGVVNV
ncbi:MAG: hypothetical protein LC772_00745, partial [Chloroflexi bacterium]|nr:hypothetical protein [Chloroflexota bacterium]